MGSSEDKAICAAIGRELTSEYLAIFVETMLALRREEMLHVITKCGGKPRHPPITARDHVALKIARACGSGAAAAASSEPSAKVPS